ncbi:MAG: hypothetical protein CMJ78_00325 [Planctomycetaceae bacterium]|nr:hypothetical protein [Planctomycetaceae bacterium]
MRKLQPHGIQAILVAVILELGCAELSAETSVTVVEHERRTVYHSPQTPGFTCWTGLWAMPDKTVMLAFTQATGPLKGRPKAPPEVLRRLDWPPSGRQNYDMTGLDLSNVYLQSTDHGTSWKKVGEDHFRTCMNGAAYHRAQLALANGTIIRCVWGRYLPYENPPLPQTGLLQRSDDRSKTWQSHKVILNPKKYTMLVTRLKRLRDGRILAIGGIADLPADNKLTRAQLSTKQYPGLIVSHDNAKTWSEPIAVVPPDHAKNWGGEEFDVAELANGDLLCVYRRRDPNSAKRRDVRWQGILAKQDDTWVPKQVGPAPFPHSGHPNLLATREGPVLHIATTGIHWTTDEGRSWHRLNAPATYYYPDSLQGPDGKIYISAHVGGDNAYGSVDQSIKLDTFRLKVSR